MPYLLLFVVLVEGFTTLAMQLVALRNAIPLVGSSIILTSVVIGVILLALAVGYRNGGRLTAKLSDAQITRKLAWLLLGAALYYVILVFPLQQDLLLIFVQKMPYTAALFVFSVLFFFLPVAAASHTMPMITQLTQGNKGFAAGKILFVSTIGSFLGSVLTSTVLFSAFGVAETGYITAGLLLICHMALMLHQKRLPWVAFICVGVVAAFMVAGSRSSAAGVVYSHDSAYQQIQIREGVFHDQPIRSMVLNGGHASSIYESGGNSWFRYIRTAVETTDARQALSSSGTQKNHVLVIGAAGFTYPEEIAQRAYIERIDTVDVDASVKPIAEKYFQQRTLNEKINFVPQSARGFMRNAIENKVHYDTILVDAYNGTSIPEELVTEEFFRDLRVLSSNIMLNMIMDLPMQTDFAQHLLATLQAAWPEGVRIKNVSEGDGRLGNFIIASRPFAGAEKYEEENNKKIYTDNAHSVEVDKAEMFYGK